MKKVICLLSLALSFVIIISATVVVQAIDNRYGLYDLSDSLIPKDAKGVVVQEATTVGDKNVYIGAEQVSLTYKGAIKGAYYLVLVRGENSSRIAYIDQLTATGSSLTFNIYPDKLERGMKYIISLVSSSDPKVSTLTEKGSFYYYAPGATISGTVDNSVKGVTIRLFSQSEADAVIRINTGAYNSYFFNGIEDGNYIMEVSKNGFITRRYSITVSGKDVIQNLQLCSLGDVNGDGTVNALDLQCLYTFLSTNKNVGKISDSEYFEKVVDVINDKECDVYDLQRLYEHVSGINKF